MTRCEDKEELENILTAFAESGDLTVLAESFVEVQDEFAVLGAAFPGRVWIPGAFRTTLSGHRERKGVAVMGEIAEETERHIDAIEWDEPLVQETRGWDAEKNVSFSMREKENATDYFYFPHPDLPPVVIDEDWIERVRQSLPEMPDAKCRRYVEELGVKEKDAQLITASPALAGLFEEAMAAGAPAQDAANWIVSEVLALSKKAGHSLDDVSMEGAKLAEIIRLVNSGELTRPNAKRLLAAVYEENVDVAAFIREQGLDQVADSGQVRGLLERILEENPKSVADFKGGKAKALDFLFGQAMRELKGAGDPAVIRQILTELLS